MRLEQGRERHPSPAVLDGLSTALLLDRASARYLRELAAADGAEAAYLVIQPNYLPDHPTSLETFIKTEFVPALNSD